MRRLEEKRLRQMKTKVRENERERRKEKERERQEEKNDINVQFDPTNFGFEHPHFQLVIQWALPVLYQYSDLLRISSMNCLLIAVFKYRNLTMLQIFYLVWSKPGKVKNPGFAYQKKITLLIQLRKKLLHCVASLVTNLRHKKMKKMFLCCLIDIRIELKPQVFVFK